MKRSRSLTEGCALQGSAGEPIPRPLLTSALKSRDLFIYFGHGAGEEYLPPASLRRLPSCAASMLIGCSSGRLRHAGKYEPYGTILTYLSAGGTAYTKLRKGLS